MLKGMMKKPTHTNLDAKCPSCEIKLMAAHPILRVCFRRLREWYKDLHIAWSFRNEDQQNEAFRNKHSLKVWPDSKHNHMRFENSRQVPCSLAVDVFFQTKDGHYSLPVDKLREVHELTKKLGFEINWGGNWKEFKDLPHFELPEDDMYA